MFPEIYKIVLFSANEVIFPHLSDTFLGSTCVAQLLMYESASHTETELAVQSISWTTPYCVAGNKWINSRPPTELPMIQEPTSFVSLLKCLGNGNHRYLWKHVGALWSSPGEFAGRTSTRRTFLVFETFGRQWLINGGLLGDNCDRWHPLPW